ncbi:KpsF/GutQ family sugar-phosphate isomerase [Pelosinus propionicus]|uniref:Arabinose-5-phosphate isomerase n=1 Tax=Pelosinus propionicus DSM 13327 TaxID=1123291 RepID=A0A1I4MHF1_9FIRM|nr:SIS domain-containing protein [Pelosinus propionicus]SFM02668.1 arabinose-5-phosphate isomerase [Pelosinus propionicus DSM 13327]
MMSVSNKEVLQKYVGAFMTEVDDFVEQLDIKSIDAAKDLILTAEKNKNRVHVTGIGKPGHIAGYIASLLSSTGTPTYELHGTEAIHGSAGQVLPGDVVIAISNSGETNELKATVETLKRNGAKIISVSGNANSWLAAKSDVFLFAGVQAEGDVLNKPPRASIMAEMIVLQGLSVVLQTEKGLTIEQYVKWHPGGSLGKEINKELSK